MPRTAIGCLATLVLLAPAAIKSMAAEPVVATVRGAEALYVRRGPGTEYPAFATLEKGEQVQPQSRSGAWVLVRIPSGEEGYVHGNFLDLPAGAQLSGTEEPAAPAESSEPTHAESPPPAVDVAVDVASEQPAAPMIPAPAPPATPSVGDLAGLQADVQRLLRLTEEVHDELATPPTLGPTNGSAVGYDQTPDPGPILALAGAGLVLGFMLGTVYGRRQERNRRTRVRF
jgi:hypothetical protein